jgi:hypothetical protein
MAVFLVNEERAGKFCSNLVAMKLPQWGMDGFFGGGQGALSLLQRLQTVKIEHVMILTDANQENFDMGGVPVQMQSI